MAKVLDDFQKSSSEIILYQTADGQSRVQCRFENESIWLTQALMAELFQKDIRTINEHLQNIFNEKELQREAVIRKFRTTAADGKSYATQHALVGDGQDGGGADCGTRGCKEAEHGVDFMGWSEGSVVRRDRGQELPE